MRGEKTALLTYVSTYDPKRLPNISVVVPDPKGFHRETAHDVATASPESLHLRLNLKLLGSYAQFSDTL